MTTKLWQCHHRPELVREGCVDSMTKLGVEQLDLFLMHFPVSFQPGVVEATTQEMMDDVPIEDTWRAMEKLVDEGLVRNIGVSNFEIDELKRIQAVATKPVACNQFETHPYYQRNELVEYCAANGIAVTAHSSMGGQNNAMKAFHASRRSPTTRPSRGSPRSTRRRRSSCCSRGGCSGRRRRRRSSRSR